jgi:hypothetical protein
MLNKLAYQLEKIQQKCSTQKKKVYFHRSKQENNGKFHHKNKEINRIPKADRKLYIKNE